ncbi:MAG: hypothetical protein OEL75_03620 [Kiritimatiellaceae bacterium]|nr:hypothetical protein [Kiritimatiellaceae bacterium]
MTDENQQIDGDLADSIAMLEQILEIMPEDTTALKALYNAYGQAGRQDRCFEYLTKLTDAVCAEPDAEVSEFIVDQLQNFKEDYLSESAACLERLRGTKAPVAGVGGHSLEKESSDSNSEVDISEELALAWRLYEENQLTQEDYSSILSDLTETSSKEIDVPVSVSHVLHDRGFGQMNRIINYMSSRSGVPFISLRSSFELSEKLGAALPLEMMSRDGVLPFGYFGDDLLVAVLNPYNTALLDKAEKASGLRCHSYLVLPEDYDAVLGKIRESIVVA